MFKFWWILALFLSFNFIAEAQRLENRGSGKPFNRQPTQLRMGFSSFINPSEELEIRFPEFGLHKTFRNKNAQIFGFNEFTLNRNDSVLYTNLGLSHEFHLTFFKEEPYKLKPYLGTRFDFTASFLSQLASKVFTGNFSLRPKLGAYYLINRSFLLDFGIGYSSMYYQTQLDTQTNQWFSNDGFKQDLFLNFSFGWMLP